MTGDALPPTSSQARTACWPNPGTEQQKPIATLHDLLSAWQWRWLAKEHLLWKFMPGVFDQLRVIPYPLDPGTAALIDYLSAEYVLPWPVAEVDFARWVYPSFREAAIQVEVDFNGVPRSELELRFGRPELVEELGIQPVVDALPGDWPAQFAEECEQHRQAIEASVEGTALLRESVRMPYLPLGGTLLSFLPLKDGNLIDTEALALCEACAGLSRDGYVRLGAGDPHPLAWHRFYPKGEWWGYPRPCSRDVFLEAAEQARLALQTCPARKEYFDGRLHLHFMDYIAWEGRCVPGDPGTGLFRGLWVEGWNVWARDPGVGCDGLAGVPVGVLPNPCRFAQGKDFAWFESLREAEAALGSRRAMFLQKVAVAKVEAGKVPGYWPFSENQRKVLDVLGGKVLKDVELALALEGDEDAAAAAEGDEEEQSKVSKQRTLYREISLLVDMGLIAHDRSLPGYYRPDRPPVEPDSR
jgi:hypothetical protein